MPYFGLCVGCLKSGREVSGVVLVTLNNVLGGMMCKQFINIPLDSFLLAASFSPSGLGMDKKCPYLGCLWGVCKVSVWCLDGLGVIWDTSMGDKIVILNEKVQSLSYNSHTTFSPSAHFLAKIGQKWRIFRPLLRGVKRHFWSKSTYSPGFIHKTAPKNAWERSTLNQSPPYQCL